MITEAEYDAAIVANTAAEKVIHEYHKQEAELFDRRLIENPIFTDEELRYSASALCFCGHGMAYPTGCGAFHYWDCSAILKGIADDGAEHRGQESFTFSGIKGESERVGTTRGVFLPRQRG